MQFPTVLEPLSSFLVCIRVLEPLSSFLVCIRVLDPLSSFLVLVGLLLVKFYYIVCPFFFSLLVIGLSVLSFTALTTPLVSSNFSKT